MLIAAAAMAAAGCTAGKETPKAGQGSASLAIMQGNYPRAYFFRAAESPGKNPSLSYEAWEKTFSRLMGIEGKALNEEVPGLAPRNVQFFTRFKEQHPEQLVLLHFNGNARDPRYQTDDYYAGHWIYFNGCKVLSEVPAEGSQTEIKVEAPGLFKTNVGRYKNKTEDIGLCELTPDGKPDWSQSEQVQLISVDPAKKMIRVRRGCYGTKPRAFAAGKAYAAAHVYEGPWGSANSNLMWFYNYSTKAPRDAKGRSAGDVLVGELVKRFSASGELAAFDGLEFDVMFFENRYHPDLRNPKSGRGMDVDADGKVDQAVFDGVDTYGLGVVEFCRRLRERFPQNKLLMADGMAEKNQRAFHILNGIESEGFPHLRDLEMRDWSGGLNRHFFWMVNARPPVFNYINHKYNKPDPKTGLPIRPDIPFGIHRLAFAAGVFTDSAMCYSYAPEAEPGEKIGIWDEFRMGTENKLGWLGKPVGPAVRLAERTADLLQGDAKPFVPAMLGRLKGAGAEFAIEDGRLKVTNKNPSATETRFVLTGVPAKGPDLFVSAVVRAAPWKGYPPEVARLMRVGIPGGSTGPFMTWVNGKDFEAGFYFSDVTSSTVNLEFAIEGSDPVWISELAVYGHPDTIYREFEHGVVLANPAPCAYTFDLGKLLPGKSYRRLEGSSRQDPATNDGSEVSGQVTLGAKDALFLVRQ